MKITLLMIGKTDLSYLKEGIDVFVKRLKHYVPFEMKIIQDIKNSKNRSFEQQKTKEGELILQQISKSDDVILMDEKGKEFSSRLFSEWIEKKMIAGTRNLVFVIGGPYGFSDEVYRRANGKIALSRMTFSHQMVRLIFVEQIYRAMSIMKGEPYHHD